MISNVVPKIWARTNSAMMEKVGGESGWGGGWRGTTNVVVVWRYVAVAGFGPRLAGGG